MLRTYGLWAHPGANHIGEYIAWSDELLASAKIQYFYDPAGLDPWQSLETTPEFVYSFSGNPTARPMFKAKAKNKKKAKGSADPAYVRSFSLNGKEPEGSDEPGVPIAEAIFFDEPADMPAVNMLNNGYIPNVLNQMAVEVPAIVDGGGIHPKTIAALPAAVAAMISQQGTIHQLLIEAYREKSKRKFLSRL
jgi:alpha-galactosidase